MSGRQHYSARLAGHARPCRVGLAPDVAGRGAWANLRVLLVLLDQRAHALPPLVVHLRKATRSLPIDADVTDVSPKAPVPPPFAARTSNPAPPSTLLMASTCSIAVASVVLMDPRGLGQGQVWSQEVTTAI